MLVALLVAQALVAGPAEAAAPTAWVGLDQGRIGAYEWSVQAGPVGGAGASDSRSAGRPCVVVGTSWQPGRFSLHRSRYRACLPASEGLSASASPVIAIGVQPSTGAPVGMTAVGMILAPGVRQVRATLPDGATQSIPVRKLSSVRARAARVGELRYAAFAVRGWWCAERLVTVDGAGRTLWDSGTDAYECSADGAAGPAPATFEP